MSPTAPRIFRLPDLEKTFSVFPDHGCNPNHATVHVQSRAWINCFTPLVYGPRMCAFLENCSFELVGSYCWPYANEGGLKAAMDYAYLVWLYDEFTDTQTGVEAKQSALTVARSLREPNFDDYSWICRMMKEFHQNHIEKAGANTARRFISHFCSYTNAVSMEAFHRETEILDIPSYIALRRETSGVYPTFDLVEYCLGIDLPQSIHDDPVFSAGYKAAADLVLWTNDVVSYNMEQAKGHGNVNILTVIMKSKGINLQSALDFAGGYCEALTTQVNEVRCFLASHKDSIYSQDALRVLDGYGDWVRGNNEWSFITQRYFGEDNTRVKETKLFELTPSEYSTSLNPCT